MSWKVIGVDLTSFSRKPSTVAVIDSKRNLHIFDVFALSELIDVLNEQDPKIIALDSPLQLPKKGSFRDCDIEMKKLGMRPLPPSWRGMRKLVYIASKIVDSFPNKVIECFPTGALNLSHVKLSERGFFSVFQKILYMEGVRIRSKFAFKKDALDAFLCSLASKRLYIKERDKLVIIHGKECEVYVPII